MRGGSCESLSAAPGGSGHNAYQDEPQRYMANVRAFLLDLPLPDPPYRQRRPPDDYEGPA
jgi:hypothetical protein